MADDLGVALQITNILRDVREDFRNNRIYLPAEDLTRFGIEFAPFGEPEPFPTEAMQARFATLVEFEAARAREWYGSGLRLLATIDRRSAACTGAMAGIYRRLLDRIAANPHAVLEGRMSLPGSEKALVAAEALAGLDRWKYRKGAGTMRAVVVGGGLAGITAAIALAQAGAEVTVLEAKPRLGGATMSFTRDGLAIDTGQHVFLRCCTAYRGLLDRLGMAAHAPAAAPLRHHRGLAGKKSENAEASRPRAFPHAAGSPRVSVSEFFRTDPDFTGRPRLQASRRGRPEDGRDPSRRLARGPRPGRQDQARALGPVLHLLAERPRR